MRDLMAEFIAEHERLPRRGEVHAGAGLGEWGYDQQRLYAADTLDSGRRAALEAIPGWSWSRPSRVASAPRSPRTDDRGRSGRSLQRLVAEDERIVRSTRAPAIPRCPPDPSRGLVVMVDLGYRDPRRAFTLVCSPRHRWIDLGAKIDQVYCRDEEHLAEFVLPAKPLRAESFPPPRAPEDRCLRLPWSYWRLAGKQSVTEQDLFEYVEDRDPDVDYTGCLLPVASLLGVGHAITYLFDFGDRWTSTIRPLRTACPDEDEQSAGGPPLLAVFPATDPPLQYPHDPPAPENYYLGLDLLDVPER